MIVKLQILKDEATREQYDYAIAHPEEVLLTLFVQLKMYQMGLFTSILWIVFKLIEHLTCYTAIDHHDAHSIAEYIAY